MATTLPALPTTNGITPTVELNQFYSKTTNLNPISRLFRWTVSTSVMTKDWSSFSKNLRDVFEGIQEVAQYKNYTRLHAWAEFTGSIFSQARKALILPFFLGAVETFVYDKKSSPFERGQQVLRVALSATLVFRFTFGLVAFATPLNYVMLAHYSVDAGVQIYKFWQVRSYKQGFDLTNSSTEQKNIVNSEHTLQIHRVVDAVASLATEIFSQMNPQMKLVNVAAGALGSLYSMSISCYHEMQVPHHLKLTYKTEL